MDVKMRNEQTENFILLDKNVYGQSFPLGTFAVEKKVIAMHFTAILSMPQNFSNLNILLWLKNHDDIVSWGLW